MDAIEKRALEANPNVAVIEEAMNQFPEGSWMRGALDHAAAELAVLHRRCQRAALTPPEGYVMVPVDPTVEMMEAAGRVVFQESGQQWSEPAGHAERFVIETQRLCHAAMLAARPEVP